MNINLGEKNKKINSSEKKVLIKMLENPGKTYSREEIGKISGISQERSIDVMVTRLRQKIEINPYIYLKRKLTLKGIKIDIC